MKRKAEADISIFSYLISISQAAFACSKLTIETLEQGVKYVQRLRSGIFIVNFEHISHLVLVFLLLTLNMQLSAGFGIYVYVYVNKTLGVHLTYNKALNNKMNFLEAIMVIENVSKLWRMQNLTLEGGLVIFKVLALSKIVYLALLAHVYVLYN